MTLLRDLRCPHCGRTNNLHDAVDKGQPEPGDVGICWACHGLIVMTALGFLRKPNSAEEEAELRADPGVKRALGAMTESHTPQQALRLLRGDG